MVSLLSLVSQICLFCFLNYSSKLRRENKEIRSGGLWFSYKYIAVSKHTRNERNLFHERNRPDRSYEVRRALSGKFTVKFS